MSEIDVYQPPPAARTDIDSWVHIAGQVIKLANEIADTVFVPDGLRGSVPAVAAAILTGRELGLPPLTSLANIHVIKGKPALSAVLMRALVQAQGHQWQDIEVTDTRAVVRARRRGEAEWTEASFTAAQAQKAGINLGGYPADKLYARATSRLCRRKFADVVAGMPYSAEELEDGATDEPVTVKPAADGKAIEPAKPTTLRRKPRPAPPPAAPTPSPPPQEAAGPPPLPGEPEPEPEPKPEPKPDGKLISDAQLTKLWTVLTSVFHFGDDEHDHARAVAAHIIGRDLDTSKNLTRAEASTVLDTLALWEDQAKRAGEDARAWLLTMMAGAEAAGTSPIGDQPPPASKAQRNKLIRALRDAGIINRDDVMSMLSDWTSRGITETSQLTGPEADDCTARAKALAAVAEEDPDDA